MKVANYLHDKENDKIDELAITTLEIKSSCKEHKQTVKLYKCWRAET